MLTLRLEEEKEIRRQSLAGPLSVNGKLRDAFLNRE
jgi:hypothetical protein